MSQRRGLGLMIYKALDKMVKLHQKGYLDAMRDQQSLEDRQISSIMQFRNICYGFRERRQKKYIQRWF
jgi:hypothetical protein